MCTYSKPLGGQSTCSSFISGRSLVRIGTTFQTSPVQKSRVAGSSVSTRRKRLCAHSIIQGQTIVNEHKGPRSAHPLRLDKFIQKNFNMMMAIEKGDVRA